MTECPIRLFSGCKLYFQIIIFCILRCQICGLENWRKKCIQLFFKLWPDKENCLKKWTVCVFLWFRRSPFQLTFQNQRLLLCDIVFYSNIFVKFLYFCQFIVYYVRKIFFIYMKCIFSKFQSQISEIKKNMK